MDEEAEMLSRHNRASQGIEVATTLQRLTSRLLEAHEDRGTLIMAQQRLIQKAIAKGYTGTSGRNIIEAAIDAAPDILDYTGPDKPQENAGGGLPGVGDTNPEG